MGASAALALISGKKTSTKTMAIAVNVPWNVASTVQEGEAP